MKFIEIILIIGFLVLALLWGAAIVESAQKPMCKPLPKAIFI